MSKPLLALFHMGQIFKQKDGPNFRIIEVLPRTVAVKTEDEKAGKLYWYEKSFLQEWLNEGRIGLVENE